MKNLRSKRRRARNRVKVKQQERLVSLILDHRLTSRRDRKLFAAWQGHRIALYVPYNRLYTSADFDKDGKLIEGNKA